MTGVTFEAGNAANALVIEIWIILWITAGEDTVGCSPGSRREPAPGSGVPFGYSKLLASHVESLMQEGTRVFLAGAVFY